MFEDTWTKNKIPISIACGQWFLTTLFQIDRLFFQYEVENKVFYMIKVLYFITLVISWIFVFHVYHKIKEGDEAYKRGFWLFSRYLCFLMLVLLVLWPGTWSWDDSMDLLVEKQYGWTAWQHILTGIYQEILLQILPFPGGIILLQNVGIAVMVSFVIVKLEKSFHIPIIKHVYVDLIIKMLPFCLPPVLMYQFSGYRMGVYVYVELTFLTIWVCSVKDKGQWNWKYMTLFSILCAVAATWRTESLFYIPMACLGILLMKPDILSGKKKIVCIVLIICTFFGIDFVQTLGLGNNSYKIASIMRPCVEIIHVADPKADQKFMEDLSAVIDLDVVYDNPEKNGEELFWHSGTIKPDYTDEDYKKCLKGFAGLCLKYPKVVFQERFALFVQSAGITGLSYSNVSQAYSFFDPESGNRAAELVKSENWIVNKPVFPRLRKMGIHLLNIRKGSHIYKLRLVVWNAALPLMVLVYVWYKTIRKKEWFTFIIITSVVIKIPIVFLTQPSCWFMYFLSFYFLGYVMLIYGIQQEYSRRREKGITRIP